jgi:hypothetical protein
MTGDLHINYEALTQEAQRGIVRAVLSRVADLGYLPGEHHFYIAFDTRAPGVVVSKRLKQKYPEEMTVVLQHQFSNLTVDEECFQVTLSFGNVPERLTIPLRAVRVFFDPSVPYGLQFDSSDLLKDVAAEAEPSEADAAGSSERNVGAAARRSAGEAVTEAGTLANLNGARTHGAARDARAEVHATSPAGGLAEPGGGHLQRRQSSRPKAGAAKPDQPANDAKVVQLDKFRKR